MNPRRVHFVAIGGTGMGSLAGLLQARGMTVTGSDEKLYPPMSTALSEWGIAVNEGFRAENVRDARPDLVVIGNVVQSHNVEARAAIDAGIPYLSFSDALYQLAIAGHHSVVVCGTHGKTTTTSLVATLLLETDRDPSVLVGGIAENLGGSFRNGAGEHFVVEGDEYDTAFFDKTPKFLHYGPQTALLTSVEFDHADIYRDLEHVKETFRLLVDRMPEDGLLIAALDAPNVPEVVRDAPCRVVGYALEPGIAADWRAEAIEPGPRGTTFDVVHRGETVARAEFAQWGRYNVANALVALATATELGVPVAAAVQALTSYRGVRRRQELRGEVRGITVLDDFAHHPTAVRETIEAMRGRFPGRRVIAILEPRTNTSRRATFQQAYVDALAGADRAVIAVVPDGPIYSATGEVTERLSSAKLADDLNARGTPAIALDGVDRIVSHLAGEASEGDILITLSNGAFGNIWPLLLSELQNRR